MNLDVRLKEHLRVAGDQMQRLPSDLSGTLARGRRRKRIRVLASIVAVAAFLAGTAFLLRAETGGQPVVANPSPTTATTSPDTTTAPQVTTPYSSVYPLSASELAPPDHGPMRSGNGEVLPPGRYAMFGPSSGSPSPGWPKSVIVTLPEGWTDISRARGGGIQALIGSAPVATLIPSSVGNVVADGCSGHLVDPPVGPTVDDLVAALSSIPGVTPGPPTEVSLGGHAGVRLDLIAPSDLPECDGFTLWTSTPAGAVRETWGVATPQGWHHAVWILDVEGLRFVIDLAYVPETTPARRAQMEQIVRSMEITP